MEEQALAEQLRNGSRMALEQAIRRYTPYVSAVVLRTLGRQGSREDVEEVVSDVFLALWAHAGQLEAEHGLRPWLGTVARNKATDFLRTKRPPTLPQQEGDGAAEGPEEQAVRREWAGRLWDAVDTMDEPDRTLFLRYYYFGDKLKDTARALGLSQAAAKQRLFRGRRALRDKLTQGGDGA